MGPGPFGHEHRPRGAGALRLLLIKASCLLVEGTWVHARWRAGFYCAAASAGSVIAHCISHATS